jgi:outer membrane immunogenic protein
MRGFGPGFAALTLTAMAGLALVLVPVVVSPARAADMAPAPGYYPPKAAYMPPALYNWTGFYVGGHIGAGFLSNTVTYTSTTTLETNGTTNPQTPYGFAGGGQIGANIEFAPWVVGVEGSFTALDISGMKTGPTNLSIAAFNPINERWKANPRWLAAGTVRFGYAADTLLIYAKGGAAFMSMDNNQDILTSGGVTFSTTPVDYTRIGFTAGAGLEYGMTENLSAKLEYDFYDFGSKNVNFTVTTPTPATVALSTSIQSYVHVLTVGLNYRFNWAGGSP